jgi:hypothetical protein
MSDEAARQESSVRRVPVLVALVVVAVAGVANLANPFTGDQALFALGGRMMARGAVYYRDFWDIKQPGIYLFYEVGGRLSGGDARGVHALELAWMLAFTVALLVCLRRDLRSPWALALVPIFAVGTYYVVTIPTSQTLIEGLVGFPLFVAMWASIQVTRDPAHRLRWALLAGLATGVVGLFKLIVVAIALWFWITALVRLVRDQMPRRELVRTAAAGVAGVLIVLGPFLVYYAAIGILGLVYRTTVVYPPQITRLGGMHDADLLRGLVRGSVRAYGWLALLGGFGLVSRWRRGRRLDLLTIDLVGWLAVGGLVVVSQKWNAYQVELILVPLAILAARAIDDLVAQGWRTRAERVAVIGLAVAVAVAGSLTLTYPTRKARALAHNGYAIGAHDRETFRREVEEEYRLVASEVGRLGPLPGKGELYVLGHPLYSQLLNAPQPLALNGWSPEQWLDAQWAWFDEQLTEARPRFLFVDHRFARRELAAHPTTRALIDSLYVAFDASPTSSHWGGTWYELRG